SRENHGSDGVPFLHEVLLSTTIRLSLRGAAYGKSEILPPYNAQICQRIFDGLPFRNVFGRDGLNTIEDRGFCRRYSLQELFTVKLQKRNLVFILPFGIKNVGRPRTAHDQASCTTKRLSACTRNRHHRRGGRMCNETEHITSCAARPFVAGQVIDSHPCTFRRVAAKVLPDQQLCFEHKQFSLGI